MAKDNNNINTDDLTTMDGVPPSSSSSSSASATGGKVVAAADTATSDPPTGDTNVSSATDQPSPAPMPTPAPVDPPARREENPFSFKHFLKWDGPAGGGGTSHYNHTINGVSSVAALGAAGGAGHGSNGTGINHSRSTSNINGHGSSSILDGCPSSNDNGAAGMGGGSSLEIRTNAAANGATMGGTSIGQTNMGGATSAGATGSPSKSATTSSLNVVSSTTGARPKIPQFQSVNTLSSESKMKRSPRFPSFDSQSSLSDFASEDRFGSSSIYQSRSNSSFTSDYPPAGVGSGGGGLGLGAGLRGTHTSNGGEDGGESLGRGYVPRSYSNYDLDSPGSAAAGAGSGTDHRRHGEVENEPVVGSGGGRLVGATEFSAALPDFVQDHLVMEQWYNTLPKGAGGGGGGGVGSGSSGSVDLDDMFELAGVASGAGGSGPIINDMPFDLTASSNSGCGGRRRDRRPEGHRNSPIIPLDLPPSVGGGVPEIGLDLPHRRVTPTPSSAELPPDLTEGNAGNGDGARSRPYYYQSVSSPPPPSGASSSGGAAGTADKTHRLPDFLSDGPIHSSGRLADVTHDTPHCSESAAAVAAAAVASDQRQRMLQRYREAQYQGRLETELAENERLRRELDQTRQTVAVQSRRIRELERDLVSMVSSRGASVGGASSGGNGGSTQSNANSFMQAKSRAATAEAELKKLRQKMSTMSVEMETLRRENGALKEDVCGGAMGGSGGDTGAGAGVRSPLPDGAEGDDNVNRQRLRGRECSSAFIRAQKIALRQAASSAENNLRQLLSGVENLRTIANQLESFSACAGAQADEMDSATGVGIPLEDYLHGVAINSEDDDDNEDDDDDDEDDALGPAL